MGKINQGILGGFSGKVGNVVGGSWKGIDYMRVMPATVSNPQTVPQMQQRTKFSLTMAFVQPLAAFLKTSFKAYAVKKSGINAAMGYNLKNSISGIYPAYAVDYTNALVARGSLAASLNQVATSTVPGIVHFAWDDNSDESGADGSDKTLLVVYNPTKHQAATAEGLATRATKTQDVTVPASFSGDQVHCYMAYITDNGADVSTSRYAGAINVA